MDTRPTVDQSELYDTVRRLNADLGPGAVGDLDNADRRSRLEDALGGTGVRALRESDGSGSPLASGVEASLVAEALGSTPADVAYLGPLLAGDLMRRAGLGADGESRTVVLTRDLSAPAVADGNRLDHTAVAIDAEGAVRGLVLVRDGQHHRLAEVELGRSVTGSDLTRRQVDLEVATPLRLLGGEALSDDSLAAWTALGLSVAAADAVGAMRGAVALAVDYVAERRQYGVPVGSFQAVQHLLADAHTLTEGSLSISRHASWTVDALDPAAARRAAATAAAYVGRAQQVVGETVIQAHGGIGNTWECMAHVFLRRTMHDDAILGRAEAQLTLLAGPLLAGPVLAGPVLAEGQIGAGDGLS